MNFQHLFAAFAGLNLNVETAYYIAIVALACVLGAEVAGICMLISRVRRVRATRRKADEPAAQKDETESDIGAFAAATLFIGALPIALQIALIALAVAAAVGALVFVVLLIVFWAKGYVLVSARDAALEQTVEEAVEVLEPEALVEEAPEEEIPEEEPTVAFVEADDEAQAQEAYTEPCVAETVEEPADVVPVTVVAQAEPVTAGQVPGGIPVYSSAYPAGQTPVIEKYIKETYKEVVKETTTTTNTNNAPTEAYSPATEEILKAIAELMKLGTQLRMEKEMAVENPAVAQNESLPTFAEDSDDADAEDIEDEDELDVEEEATEGDETSREGEEGEDDYESELFSGNERIVGFDEDTGCYIVARYRKSFEAKLIQARPNVKKYYSELKNALLGYENTRDRISWTINTYTNDRTPIAKINMRNKSVDLYLALDPATLEDSVYHGRDVGDKKKYADTPYFYKVNSPRRLTLALELIQRTCEEQGLSPIDIEFVNYEEQYPFEATEDLVRRGLIREYLREEKPAATFELDPDHAPLLPEEDASVIPVNANFTWEFDDEQSAETPAEETPVAEPVEAPVVEEPVEEEPVVEESVAEAPVLEKSGPTTTTTTTTHESIKTTEHEYTERYYGVPVPPTAPQMLPSNAEPIEAIAEPCEETVAEIAEETVEEPVEDVIEETADETVEDAVEAVDAEEELIWETEETIEEEPEEIYEEEVEEIYDEEPEEVYEEEVEEIYDEESEEGYEEEVEEIYEEEPEEVYDEEPEEIYEEEVEEEEAVKGAPASAPARVHDSTVALLDVCQFDAHFANGAVINLEALKKVGLAPDSALTLKVYASGPIKGQYTVEANHFTLDAIKAIGDADGDSIMIR